MRNGALYTGITNNLIRRVYEHKKHVYRGFTDQHNIVRLVYFEIFTDVNYAIAYEKRVKRWRRNWKKDLIEKENPEWNDLYEGLNSCM